MSNLQNRILLVEGDDDKHFVKNFCCKMLSNQLVCKFTDDDNENDSIPIFYIPDRSRQEGGVDNMIETISTEIKEPGREVVGILADANGENFDSREHPWQKIKSKLEEVLDFKEVLPELPCQKGLIRRNVKPKQKPKSTLHVGVWLMPDNGSSGELENFFAGLIEGNRTWKLAKEYVNQYMESTKQLENLQSGFDTEKPYKVSKAEVYAWLATRKKQRFARWLEELFCF